LPSEKSFPQGCIPSSASYNSITERQAQQLQQHSTFSLTQTRKTAANHC